ncbi:MAG: dihydrofolate synthase/folylpolyglutamate synthase [Mariniblastus sp.]|jgi:dihydrofolate synthase/folylpolyglutamate synthase
MAAPRINGLPRDAIQFADVMDQIKRMNRINIDSPRTIESHLESLYGRINYERQNRVTPRHFKLKNMRELLGRTGNPHLDYPVVHVAGTKGKGSVSTMVGQILSSSGRRTGVYTSPHFETLHQRMVVDNQMITDQQLIETLTTLEPAIQAMDREAEEQGFRHLTFFEITTAAAFHFFATQKCEAVVLEVGLGGRLDSTNVCQPVATIITNISLDHTRQLGDTVAKIAFEKAGIIKPLIPVISGTTDPQAAAVIAEVALANKAPLFKLDRDFSLIQNDSNRKDSRQAAKGLETSAPNHESTERPFVCHGRLALPSPNDSITSDLADGIDRGDTPTEFEYSIDEIRLRLLGEHQRLNAAVAVAAVETLNARGWKVADQAVRDGLWNAALAGRTEVVSRSPTVVIDMAHNVASIEALLDSLQNDLDEWKSSRRRVLIFATSRDKDAEGMLTQLVPNFDKIVLTRFQDNPRGRSEVELLELASAIQNQRQAKSLPAAELTTQPTPLAAWESIQPGLDASDLACIAGSAFLVAELRKTVLGALGS